MEMDEFQHRDFVWTWKSNHTSGRASLWLPYFQSVRKVKGTRWLFTYKGGEFEADLKRVDFVMLYGASGIIPVDFLDDLHSHRICLSIHRRNIPTPYVFAPTPTTDEVDALTRQIEIRQHQQKCTYIARTLIRARMNSMSWLIRSSATNLKKLAAANSVERVRALEAQETKRYWSAYFDRLGVDVARRDTGPFNSALNAGSMFLFGVILRWVLFHKLSPSHGYLHQPSSYPSLAYDLMEPYRYLIEMAVAESWEEWDDPDKLVAASISRLKAQLDESVYVPATRQTVRRKNLLHGVVLALRSYLLGEVPRLVLPIEGARKGGRPPKAGYKLPGGSTSGRIAGLLVGAGPARRPHP